MAEDWITPPEHPAMRRYAPSGDLYGPEYETKDHKDHPYTTKEAISEWAESIPYGQRPTSSYFSSGELEVLDTAKDKDELSGPPSESSWVCLFLLRSQPPLVVSNCLLRLIQCVVELSASLERSPAKYLHLHIQFLIQSLSNITSGHRLCTIGFAVQFLLKSVTNHGFF